MLVRSQKWPYGKILREGTRVRLRAFPETNQPEQTATVLGIDEECIMVEIDKDQREKDDLDGLREITVEQIKEAL